MKEARTKYIFLVLIYKKTLSFVFGKKLSQLNKIYFLSECSSFTTLTDLPESMTCSIDKACSTLDCCIHSKELQRSFHISFSVNVCEREISLGFERFSRSLKLELSGDVTKTSVNIANVFIAKYDNYLIL